MLTATLRQQHLEIGQVIAAIQQAVKAARPGHDIRLLLVELSGKLSIHLAAEDRMVYPQLQASQVPGVAALAKRFADEMGGLSGAFKAFSHRYNTGAVIDGDRAAFASGFQGIVAAVTARVKAEESELYPAADRTAAH